MGKGGGQNNTAQESRYKVAASCAGRLQGDLSDGSELSPPKGDDNNLDRWKGSLIRSQGVAFIFWARVSPESFPSTG